MRKAAVGIVAAAALAASAAGCGGGGLSEEEYVAKLNAICADASAQRAEIGDPQTLAEVVELGPRILDEFARAIERAEELGDPPGEIAGRVDRFIELSEERLDLMTQVVDAATAGNTEQIAALGDRIDPVDSEADEIARELGATDCAPD